MLAVTEAPDPVAVKERVKPGIDEICSEAGTVAVAAGVEMVSDESAKPAWSHASSNSVHRRGSSGQNNTREDRDNKADALAMLDCTAWSTVASSTPSRLNRQP